VPTLVECRKIRKARLDTVMQDIDAQPNYLLKIDVDGHELPILEGATETLKQCSIVVVEAPVQRSPLPHLISRANYLLEAGFFLVDVVDLAYYRGLLSQVDLIFVHSDIVHDLDTLRPWETSAFDRTQWYPYSHSIEGKPRPGRNRS